MLLAGFVFLHFAATIRSALGSAETSVRGSVQLARVAFAGAITGMAGMTMAIVIISSATTEGADANPVVTRAVASASAGPFLLSAMGFAAFLLPAGLVTLRSGVFARWTGVVALIGAVSFLVTFAAVLSGLGEDSLFGFGFFPGVLALVIWSIATSLARYRAARDYRVVVLSATPSSAHMRTTPRQWRTTNSKHCGESPGVASGRRANGGRRSSVCSRPVAASRRSLPWPVFATTSFSRSSAPDSERARAFLFDRRGEAVRLARVLAAPALRHLCPLTTRPPPTPEENGGAPAAACRLLASSRRQARPHPRREGGRARPLAVIMAMGPGRGVVSWWRAGA